MSFMKWTPENYGTEVAIFDKQHQEIFNRVNDLNEAVLEGVRQEIGSCLDRLIEFVIVHFQSEEHLMEEKGFPGLDEHRQVHADLVSTCADLQEKFHANEVEIETTTMTFIKEWLEHHIPVVDRQYGPVLK
jgi:hemerythrin